MGFGRDRRQNRGLQGSVLAPWARTAILILTTLPNPSGYVYAADGSVTALLRQPHPAAAHALYPYLELATKAVRGAGRIALGQFGVPQFVWFKDGDQPVTPTDIRADRMIARILGRARLNAGDDRSDGLLKLPIVSEENAASHERLYRVYWLVDPIDGSRSFATHDARFAASIALIIDNAPVIGVIHDPVEATTYQGIAGVGAWKMRGREVERLSARGSSGAGLVDRAQIRVLADRWNQHLVAGMTPVPYCHEDGGSTARKLMRLTGDIDLFFWPDHCAPGWDTAAAEVIVRESGGVVTDAEGDLLLHGPARRPERGMIFAANEDVHRLALEASARFRGGAVLPDLLQQLQGIGNYRLSSSSP